MKFTVETNKNKRDEEWSPLPHELAVQEIDVIKGVFTTLNKKWAKRGIRLAIALSMLTSFNSKLGTISHASPQGVVAEASIGGGMENAHTVSLIPDDVEKVLDEEALITEPEPEEVPKNEAPQNLPVEENVDQSSPKTPPEIVEDVVVMENPVDVEENVVTPHVAVEEEMKVDKEAVSKINQELKSFAENLPIGKQSDLVDDIRTNYDALVQYAKGERNDAVKNGKEDFRNLVGMIEKKMNDLNPPTRKLAKQNILEMMQIINDYGKLRIPGKLAEWAKR